MLRAMFLCFWSVFFVQSAAATVLTVESEAANAAAALKPLTLKDQSLEAYAHWSRPAAGDIRPASDFDDNYAIDAGEALFFAPGVSVNALDLREPRIVIRGFGVGNRQERSTVRVLRDGAPLTDVHGTTNTQELDLLAVSRVEVLRGGGDFRFTGDNLGGAVNFVSPTGRDRAPGRTARVDAGASIEGTPGARAHADISGRSAALDYFASVTGIYDTGFRDNSDLSSVVLNANLGYRVSSAIFTRFFVEAVRSNAELSGGLLPADAADDPSQAAPPMTLGPLFPGGPIIEFADGAEQDEHSRDLLVGRISNRTTFQLLGHDVQGDFHYARREIESPQIDFIGVLDESGGEWGARLSAKRHTKVLGLDTEYRAGVGYAAGGQDSDRFENIDGRKGDQLVDTHQKSSEFSAFVEAFLTPFKRLVINAGSKFVIVDRELTVDDDDEPEERRFTGIAARAGAAYDVTEDIQIFANATRAYEPPSFSELISDNPTDFNSLDEQDSFAYEAGVRGRAGDWIGWNITYFNADIESEIINIDDPETNGIGGSLVNIDDTTHRGVEAGLDISLLPRRRGSSGQSLTLRNVYNYNDFKFVDAGPLGDVDGNRIAGIPEHVYRGELRFDNGERWFVALNAEIGAGEFFADHENLVSAPTYKVFGFSAGRKLSDNIDLVISGENITDENYAAGITPVFSQTAQDARIFTPGNGLSIYGGLKLRL